MNVMRSPRIEKITLNVGAGKDLEKLEKGMKLIKAIAGVEPVKTVTKKRIPAWGIRPGLPIGCKLTLRKDKAVELLRRLLRAKDNKLKPEQFDDCNVSFGIPEYIDIPGVEYDHSIGIMGLEVCVTFERPGFRVKRRRLRRKKIPKKHRLTKEEIIKFVQEKFNVQVGDSE